MNRKEGSQEPADRLLNCMAAEGMLRIVLIRGTKFVREARRIHSLSRTATAAAGRQLMMTAMMAADLKNDGDLISTIIKGNGVAGSMICTGNAALEVKCSLNNGCAELPPTPQGKLDVGGYVGREGKLTVVSDLGMKEPYVGVCNLVSGEIAVDFAEYYAASLQRPSLVYLGVREEAEGGEVRSAAGALIEPLPGCPDETIDVLQEKSAQIARLSERLDSGESLEMFIMDALGGFGVEILREREPKYVCDCTIERVERALISTGRAELEDMITRDGGAEVNCRFCGKQYVFTKEALIKLLDAASAGENE